MSASVKKRLFIDLPYNGSVTVTEHPVCQFGLVLEMKLRISNPETKHQHQPSTKTTTKKPRPRPELRKTLPIKRKIKGRKTSLDSTLSFSERRCSVAPATRRRRGRRRGGATAD